MSQMMNMMASMVKGKIGVEYLSDKKNLRSMTVGKTLYIHLDIPFFTLKHPRGHIY